MSQLQSQNQSYLRNALRKGAGNLYQDVLRGYNILKNSKVAKEGGKILDFYSGGRLTEKKLDKEQDKLNTAYENFDKNYGGKELGESDYNKAQVLQAQLDSKQQQLDLARANKGAEFNKARSSSKASNVLDVLGLSRKSKRANLLEVGSVLAPALITLGETLTTIRKNPSLLIKGLTQIPTQLMKAAAEDVTVFKLNPSAGIMRVVTQTGTFYYTNKISSKGFKVTAQLTRQGVTRLLPYFRKLETTSLGIREVNMIPGVGKIEFIEERGIRFRNVNPERAVKEANLKQQLKPTPTLPKVNPIQKKILQIIKRRGDVVSGSYAQNVFLKKKFNRAFKDLDILTLNREATIIALRKKFGKAVSFKKKLKSIEVRYRGKTIADLVEFAEGEKVKGFGRGFVQKYGFARVKGLNVVRPQVRLASKVGQLGIGKRGKVLKDISLLYGKKKELPFKRPSFTGPYTGRQAKVGSRRTLTTSQADLFKSNFPGPEQAIQRIRDIILRKKPSLKLKKWFYATPDVEGIAQARVTRLGLPSKQEASLIDLFSGKATLSRGKPTVFVLTKEKIFTAPRGISKGKTIKTKGFVVPGFSRELEVVLGKGFLIQQGKRLATILIDGSRVNIIQLKKIKIPRVVKSEIRAVQKLAKRLESKRLSPKTKNKLLSKIRSRQTKLGAKIKKITKIDYASRRPSGKRVYPLGRKIASRSLNLIRRPSRGISAISRSGSSLRRGSPPPFRRGTSSFRRSGSSIRRGGSLIRRGSSSRGGSGIRYRPTLSSGRTPTKITSFIKGRKQTTLLPKAVPSFNVFAKVGRKFVKINKGLLSRADALSRGSFAIDNTTAKTFKIVSAGKRKRIASIPRQEKNYYRRASFKLREYRIKRGRKFAILPKYIEKRKFGIDTRGEKKGLTIANYLKSRGYSKGSREAIESQRIRGRTQVAVPRTFRRTRRITPSQRKVMIKNLAKARRVLARRRR